MSSVGLQTPPGKACPTSRPAGWPAGTAPEYPQASYYRARYYDPTTGRFLTEDPIQFAAGENFYRYVDNNPAFWRDASGLMPGSGPPIAVLVPSTVLPGRQKLEGNLDPLCQKGRNIPADTYMLETSISTRDDEIHWYANHPDPNMRSLAVIPDTCSALKMSWKLCSVARTMNLTAKKSPNHSHSLFQVA
jgi:RHS repeat-associated protein